MVKSSDIKSEQFAYYSVCLGLFVHLQMKEEKDYASLNLTATRKGENFSITQIATALHSQNYSAKPQLSGST